MKKIIVLIILLIIFVIGGFLFYYEGTLPVNKTATESQIFVIEPGENLDSIINNLAKEDLIRNRVVFYLIVKNKGIEKQIQAGSFRLSPSMSASEIAESLTHGTLDEWVTVPEGLRKEEVAEIMSQTFDIAETEFNQLAEEGYLFPDTYLIPTDPSAQQIIDIMAANFESKYTEELQAKARENDLTDREVIILASILEREAKYDSDRQQIANILLRRYREDHPLQVDATIQYALGYQASEKRWWKSYTTFADLEHDSPYNTYKYTGLPPAPISNPGMATIEAVVNANEDTPYLFYLSDESGNTYFSETYEEHQQKIEKYL